MELDSRIKSIDDIQTILHYDVDCIGSKGYFFNEFVRTTDLSKCRYGELVDITTHDDRNDLCFKAEYEKGLVGFYRFFLPEADLKPVEKKYRPYTKHEFLNKFECGKPINIRRKDDYINFFIETMPSVKIDNLSDDVHVRLFEGIFNLKRLFDEFEWQKSNGEWQPFGVLDE